MDTSHWLLKPTPHHYNESKIYSNPSIRGLCLKFEFTIDKCLDYVVHNYHRIQYSTIYDKNLLSVDWTLNDSTENGWMVTLLYKLPFPYSNREIKLRNIFWEHENNTVLRIIESQKPSSFIQLSGMRFRGIQSSTSVEVFIHGGEDMDRLPRWIFLSNPKSMFTHHMGIKTILQNGFNESDYPEIKFG